MSQPETPATSQYSRPLPRKPPNWQAPPQPNRNPSRPLPRRSAVIQSEERTLPAHLSDLFNNYEEYETYLQFQAAKTQKQKESEFGGDSDRPLTAEELALIEQEGEDDPTANDPNPAESFTDNTRGQPAISDVDQNSDTNPNEDNGEEEMLMIERVAHYSGSGPSKSFHPPPTNRITSSQRNQQHALAYRERHSALLNSHPATSSPCPTTGPSSHVSSATTGGGTSNAVIPAKGTYANPCTPVRNRNATRRKAPASDGEDERVSDTETHRRKSKKDKGKKKKSRKSKDSSEEEEEEDDRDGEDDTSSKSESESDSETKTGKRKRSSKNSMSSKKGKKKGKKAKRSNNRARRYQYNAATNELIAIASDELNARIMATDPFADDAAITVQATAAWENACKAIDRHILLDEGIIQVLTDSLFSLRGRFKTAIRDATEAEYQFGDQASDRAANKDLAKKLLIQSNFAFKNHLPQHAQPSGLYRNGLIGKAIRSTYFKNAKDIGVLFPAFFGPIPLEVIAHALTVMHFCVNQYNSETGARKNSKFTVEDNRARYKRYLESLHQWRNKEGQMQIVAELQVTLYQTARENCNTADACGEADVDLPVDFYTENYSEINN